MRKLIPITESVPRLLRERARAIRTKHLTFSLAWLFGVTAFFATISWVCVHYPVATDDKSYHVSTAAVSPQQSVRENPQYPEDMVIVSVPLVWSEIKEWCPAVLRTGGRPPTSTEIKHRMSFSLAGLIGLLMLAEFIHRCLPAKYVRKQLLSISTKPGLISKD